MGRARYSTPEGFRALGLAMRMGIGPWICFAVLDPKLFPVTLVHRVLVLHYQGCGVALWAARCGGRCCAMRITDKRRPQRC